MDWIAVTRALDPWRELAPARDFDTLYVEVTTQAGRVAPALRRWERTRRDEGGASTTPRFLVCGARGSGKSTQLRRLAHNLNSEWEVLLLDLAPVLPERPNTAQFVAYAGLALLDRLVSWEGADGGVARLLESVAPAKAFAETLKLLYDEANIEALVDATGTLLVATGAAVGGAPATATGLAARAWEAIRKRREPATALARSHRFLENLAGADLGAAQALAGHVSELGQILNSRASRFPVLLIDGLDKIETLAGAARAFEDVGLIAAIDVPLVITGPMALRHDPRFAGIRNDVTPLVHNNIPVVDATGADRADGVDALLEILKRRLGTALAGAVDDGAGRAAARACSGIPREFFRILSDAAALAEDAGADRVTIEHQRAAAKEWRMVLQQSLNREDIRLLDGVLRSRRLGDSEREQSLLFQNLIACYPNDNIYFRPHELLVDWVREEALRLDDGLRR